MIRILLAAICLTSFATTLPAAPPEVRVLTYNIHHGEGTDGKLDLERIAKVITAARPDIVALQEVDAKTHRTGNVDQAAELAKLTKMQVAFGAAMKFDGGEYGNAILSRWPLGDVQVHKLPRDSAESPEPRVVVESVVTPPLEGVPPFAFASTHLCHLSAATRAAQTAALDELFQQRKLPLLLAGDFNARSEQPPMQVLLAKDGSWIDLTAKISVIDYVLTRRGDGWRVRSAEALDEPVASDHLPVLAVLEWVDSDKP
jgi:endonuclease/exonuclease/phosphatase family metal-dependent hydrolase